MLNECMSGRAELAMLLKFGDDKPSVGYAQQVLARNNEVYGFPVEQLVVELKGKGSDVIRERPDGLRCIEQFDGLVMPARGCLRAIARLYSVEYPEFSGFVATALPVPNRKNDLVQESWVLVGRKMFLTSRVVGLNADPANLQTLAMVQAFQAYALTRPI